MVRTRNESLQHILDELEAGRLGAIKGINCAYEDNEGNHCAVGCLFTPTFHDEINQRGLSHVSLGLLNQTCTVLFNEATAGFTFSELKMMQSLHDDWAVVKSVYTTICTDVIYDRTKSARAEFVAYVNSLKTKSP